MMETQKFISVILPLKLEWEPCYSLPEDTYDICVGQRVKVRFAFKEYIGVVSAVGITPEIAVDRIQSIVSIEEGLEKILPEEIELWRKVAEYYLCTSGEVYKAAYPSGKVNLEEARAAAISRTMLRRERLLEGMREKIRRLEERLEKKEAMTARTREGTKARLMHAEGSEKLRKEINITSANSINILRWIPQSFYYFYGWCAWKELTGKELPEVVVPSGNYGNLTAGMLARRMGLPVKKFVAASNANDVIPEFLKSAKYQPRASVQTVANAMDVGAPSNYERMMCLCGNRIESLKEEVRGFSADDDEIFAAIKEMQEKFQYQSCPHSAVGYSAAKELNVDGFWLSTAYAAKFGEITEKAIGKKPELPKSIGKLLSLKKKFTEIAANEGELKEYLLKV